MNENNVQLEGLSRFRLLRACIMLIGVGCFGGLNLPRTATLWLPYAAIAGETREATNQATAGSQKGTPSPNSKDETVKKSGQSDVQSRGLFKKKKKKQKGGSAGHSQAGDLTEAFPR